MNVVPFQLPLRRRVAAKLSGRKTSALFTAAIDVLADIRPRRTVPQGFDLVVTPEKQVFVVRVDADDEVRGDMLGTFEEFRHDLETLGREAELTEPELRWLNERAEACIVEEPVTSGPPSVSRRSTRRRLSVVK